MISDSGVRGAAARVAGAVASAAEGVRFCITRVAPKASTLTPSAPMAAHIHFRAGPAGAAAGTGEAGEETVRFMVMSLFMSEKSAGGGR